MTTKQAIEQVMTGKRKPMTSRPDRRDCDPAVEPPWRDPEAGHLLRSLLGKQAGRRPRPPAPTRGRSSSTRSGGRRDRPRGPRGRELRPRRASGRGEALPRGGRRAGVRPSSLRELVELAACDQAFVAHRRARARRSHRGVDVPAHGRGIGHVTSVEIPSGHLVRSRGCSLDGG